MVLFQYDSKYVILFLVCYCMYSDTLGTWTGHLEFYSVKNNFYSKRFQHIMLTVADPGGGVPPARAPPKGPDSFVLTYKFFETEPPRELAPPLRGWRPPLREILDPPLVDI